MKNQTLKLKVLNTEQQKTGEVMLKLRSSHRITPAMRRAMSDDDDVVRVIRGSKPDSVAVLLRSPLSSIAPDYALRSAARQMLVEDLTTLAAKAA